MDFKSIAGTIGKAYGNELASKLGVQGLKKETFDLLEKAVQSKELDIVKTTSKTIRTIAEKAGLDELAKAAKAVEDADLEMLEPAFAFLKKEYEKIMEVVK